MNLFLAAFVILNGMRFRDYKTNYISHCNSRKKNDASNKSQNLTSLIITHFCSDYNLISMRIEPIA